MVEVEDRGLQAIVRVVFSEHLVLHLLLINSNSFEQIVGNHPGCLTTWTLTIRRRYLLTLSVEIQDKRGFPLPLLASQYYHR